MAGYSKQIKEYVYVKLETTDNCSAIAKEVVRVFNLDPAKTDLVRRWISTQKKPLSKDIKRLFFDIETSYLKFWGWRTGEQRVNANQVIQDKKIICICYKWQYSDEIHSLTWDAKQSDKKMIKEFIKVLGKADEIVGHNGDRFDIKELRTRAIIERILMFPKYRTLDTLKKARQYFNFNSNKLDYLGQVLQVGRKLDHEGFKLWEDIVERKDAKQLNKMVDYCKQDVILLEDVFHVIAPYIDHNTNHSVLAGGKKWGCPECGSLNVSLCHTDTTAMGYIKRHMKCKCKKQFHVSNKTYLQFLRNEK